MSSAHRPLLLAIFDGWGYRENTESNAILAAHTPCWDQLWQTAPHTLLAASGTAVGLPEGQIGNSEVGHLHIGAGRLVYQDLTRVDAAINDGSFFHNTVLVEAIQQAKKTNKAVHVLGLLSPGGVHSHTRHIHALVDLAAQQQFSDLVIHAFLDGRDTPPQSAQASLQALNDHLITQHCGQIASIIGRYYAMDRDNRWDRIQQAYALLTQGIAEYDAPTASEGLALAYQRGETDEFVKATRIHAPNQPARVIADDDVVIFINYRADRARELSHALIDKQFDRFERGVVPQLAQFVTLTEYAADIPSKIVYPTQTLNHCFGAYLAEKGLRQLRIAETEKYAHVTFFFNGGMELALPGEDRILVPSPQVSTYDQTPEMSAVALTDRLVEAIQQKKYDAIICNYANPDMLGHTGDFSATVKAIETMDACLHRVLTALQSVGGEAIITADHGNAEHMFDEAIGQPHTAHTNEPVPFIYVGRPATITHTSGSLCDIAPTLLYVMGLTQPVEMTGKSLLSFK